MSVATVHPIHAIPRQRQRQRYGIRQQRAADYRAYLEARHSAAEAETRGVMLSRGGIQRGVSPRKAWFSGRMATMRYASDELTDWFAENGPNLTSREFQLQSAPPSSVAPDDVLDVAGIRHAVDWREYEAVAYTMCELWLDPALSGAPTGGTCPECAPLLPAAPVADLDPAPEVMAPVRGETAEDPAPDPGTAAPVTLHAPTRSAPRHARYGQDYVRAVADHLRTLCRYGPDRDTPRTRRRAGPNGPPRAVCGSTLGNIGARDTAHHHARDG